MNDEEQMEHYIQIIAFLKGEGWGFLNDVRQAQGQDVSVTFTHPILAPITISSSQSLGQILKEFYTSIGQELPLYEPQIYRALAPPPVEYIKHICATLIAAGWFPWEYTPYIKSSYRYTTTWGHADYSVKAIGVGHTLVQMMDSLAKVIRDIIHETPPQKKVSPKEPHQ